MKVSSIIPAGLFLQRMAALVLVLIAGFLALRVLPGDPVLLYMPEDSKTGKSGEQSLLSQEDRYRKTASRYGLDKPLFYFSILPKSFRAECTNPDSLMLNEARKVFLRKYRHPQAYELLQEINRHRLSSADEEKVDWQRIWADPELIFSTDSDIAYTMNSDLYSLSKNPFYEHYLPDFQWYGLSNQFHTWVVQLFRGDWGISVKNQQSVWSRLSGALSWTLALQLPTVLLALMFSIFLGLWFARQPNSFGVRLVQVILQLLYALPLFVSGFLLLSLFSGSSFLAGVSFGESTSLWRESGRLILPVICLVLPSVALLSNQVRQTVEAEMQKPYATYLWLRAVPAKKVFYRYFLKNSLIPLSAEIGRIIPALISGSLLVEVVFNIPGMGRLMAESIYARDWPVLQGVLLWSAMASVAGITLSDLILYRLVHKTEGV